MIAAFIKWLATLFRWDAEPDFTNPPMPQDPIPEPENSPQQPVPTVPESDGHKLYETAKSCLGQHLTLNQSVPSELGCAEAISAILKKAGVSVPQAGIAGTQELYGWLPRHGFTRVETPEPGDIIISPTGMGNGSVRGHVGIVGKYGIMSNDSATGLFKENWDLEEWKDWYHGRGLLPVAFFRWG